MELYNSLIKDTRALLEKGVPKTWDYAERDAWIDIGSSELVLQKDAAYELGAAGKGSANYVLFTSNADLVSKDLDADVEKQMLHTAIETLSSRERYIVGLRYGLGADKEHTQKEVADIMGISQSYISRLEKRIIGKLREELARMA